MPSCNIKSKLLEVFCTQYTIGGWVIKAINSWLMTGMDLMTQVIIMHDAWIIKARGVSVGGGGGIFLLLTEKAAVPMFDIVCI